MHMEWKQYFKLKEQISDLENGMPRNKFILFITGSFGDVYPTLALLSEFCRLNVNGAHVLIDKKYSLLCDRFNYPGISYAILESESQLRQSLSLFRSVHALIPGKIYPTLPTLHPLIGEASLSQRITDHETKRLILGLPVGAPYKWGSVSEVRLKYANNILEQNNLRCGRTIIISYKNQSNSKVNPKIIKDFVDRAKKLNFDVALNNAGPGNESDEIDNCSRISVPPDLVVELHELAGYSITSVSGLSLVLFTQPHSAKVCSFGYYKNINTNAPESILKATHYTENSNNPDICRLNDLYEDWYTDDENEDFYDRCFDFLINGIK
jgi:hypothetical protein